MMKKKLSTYLEAIIKKQNNTINKEFDFSRIDKVNIFLTKQVLDRQDNLWFKANDQYLSKYYEPIIFAASVHVFENNYCEDKKTKPKIGDKYQKGNKRYEVIAVDCEMNGRENATKLKCISRKDKNSITTTASMYEYRRLKKTTQASNRNTFKPMQDFLQITLGEKEDIPSFPHKFAIVTAKNNFESCFEKLDKRAFPYTYIADCGQETTNLPSSDSMFFVASSYETIQKHIFDKNIQIESIIFIGNKYNHQIQQDINRDYFKQAIFIGKKKPDVNYLKWYWTLPEYQYFDDLAQSEIKIIEAKNEVLTKLIEKFITDIKQLERDYYINLQQRILPYISYIYPLVVLAKDSRLKNRIDDLLCSFKKKSEQVLGEEFSSVGEDCTKHYHQLVDDYSVILEQFYFENNAKTYTLQQATETDYLLVPERQTLTVWQVEIKKLNWQKAIAISLSKLQALPKQSTVTVLSLPDYDFYCSIRDSHHTINWLLYDKEYERYQNFATRYDNALIEEYKSKDRKKLTAIDYPDEIKTESVDDLQDRIWNNETDTRRYTTTYQDHIDKEIIFTDGYKIELSANSTIILIDNNNAPMKYQVSDLSIGDKIRVYENQHKEILFYAISKNGENDNFNEILQHSELWKQQLKKYCANNETIKINEIATLCGVAPSTVEGWLNNSNTKFPKNIKPLKDILGDNYDAIHKSNKQYNSIMIALGRDFSDEVSDYIMSKHKGELLRQFDDNTILVISEHNMPIRTIKKIITI